MNPALQQVAINTSNDDSSTDHHPHSIIVVYKHGSMLGVYDKFDQSKMTKTTVFCCFTAE